MTVADQKSAFLRSFMPRFAQRMVSERAAVPEGPEQRTILGAGFAADIVGSTALGEILDTTHDAGADVLSAVLQRSFGAFGTIISDSGGDLVHIAGDGVFALWPVESPDQLPGAVASAVTCGLRVQDELAGERVDAHHRLSFRVGVAAGEFWVPIVGGESQWAILIGGDPVTQLAAALDAARPGEVVASEAAARYVGPSMTTSVTGGIIRALAVESLPYDPPSGHHHSTLAERYVLENVAMRARADLLGDFAELRKLTSVFTKVGDVEGGGRSPLDRLHRITTAFQRAVGRYGGAITISLLDENGLSLVGTWGGSQHTYEDNETRGLLAALEFVAQIDGDGIGVGVSTGQTFMGDVVAAHSRRFLILGTAINLAARLAGAAPRAEVRCDLDTMIGARHSVVFDEMPPLHLKGVRDETRVFRPVGRRSAAVGDRSGLVGRQEERAALQDALRRLVTGSGGTVFIEGEAGIGKSALVEYLLGESEAQPIRRLVLRGSSLEKSTPFQPWRAVFAKLADPERLDDALQATLTAAESDLTGLLAAVLPVPAGTNDEIGDMDPAARAEATRVILSKLFVELVSGIPLLFIVEDAHWIDTATWALVEDVVERLPEALTVVVTRRVVDMEPAEVRLRREAQVMTIGMLDEAETHALACERLDVASIPDRLARLLRDRTEGHPLFTEEIIRSFRDAGVIEISTEREVTVDWNAVELAGIPSSVAAVIGSRIDRLPLEHQSSLKVASVIGRDFTASAILAIHPDSPSPERLSRHLGDVIEAGLIKVDPDNPDGFSFSHALTVDATYALLPAETRRSLHRAYAASMEDTGLADDVLLAHHFEAAGDGAAAERALDRAADVAFGSAAYREVIDLIARIWALELPARPAIVTARREALVGQSHVGLGDLKAGRDHLLEAAQQAGMPLPATSVGRSLGVLWQGLRQLAHRFTALPRLVGPGDDAERIRVGSEALFSMASLSYGQDPISLAYVGMRSANEAERIAPTKALIDGYGFLSYALGVAGRRGPSDRYRDRAIAAADAIESPTGKGEALLFHAVMLVTFGDWDRALAELAAARSLFEEAGNRRSQAQTAAVQAYCFVHQARFKEALDIYREIDRIETEDDLTQAWQQRGIGQTLLRMGKLTEAIGVLHRVEHLADEVGELPTILAIKGLLAVALWQQGRFDAATDLALEGLELMEGVESLAAAHSVDGYVSVTRVLIDAARETREPASLEAAERAVSSLRKAARRLPIAQPRAIMAGGLIDAVMGRTKRAERRFAEALNRARELGLPYEEAHISLQMGAVLADRSALELAEAHLREIGALEDARIARLLQPES